jgi:peptidoglycan/LPS O-acetylase OafA/YrhL
MQQKTHLATLDALRGVAAFSVMFFHFSLDWQSGVVLPKSYLAVDFFFALSGFVIAKAYQDKLQNRLSVAKFSWLRLQRLYPLILLALCFATVQELPRILLHSALRNGHEFSSLVSEFVFGLLMIPYFLSPNDQSFPLNPPAWSLFYELAVNLLYACVVRYLTNWRIAALMLLPGLYILHAGYTHGGMNWGHFPEQYLAGTARVVFSFFMGVLLFRLRSHGVFDGLPKLSGFWLAGVLLLTFLPKHVPWFYDPACIFLLYPLIIAIGSEDHLPARATPAALWLGRISYPLYVLHWPLIVQNRYHIFTHRHGLGLVAVTIACALATVAVSWAALMFFDEPLRERMKQGRRRGAVPSFTTA